MHGQHFGYPYCKKEKQKQKVIRSLTNLDTQVSPLASLGSLAKKVIQDL